MIVLNLLCRHQHRFEGWFASAEAFGDQQERGLVTCPVCNNAEVSRLPSGPRVISSSAAKDAAEHESVAAVQAQLRDAIKAYVRESENVGPRFPNEARKIHYKEAPARNIRGIATLEETRDLLDEGIVVVPLMVPPSEETH
ncbi:MAG: DUF1178 family protein [Rhodocyclaceae bacterium]|nr:DUF1178 family protein [Rhodocyclaceae bacterium]